MAFAEGSQGGERKFILLYAEPLPRDQMTKVLLRYPDAVEAEHYRPIG